MSETTPFWQEVRRTLMVRGDGWKSVIDELPNYVSVKEAKELIQPPSQLAILNGVGYIAGNRVETRLDDVIVMPFFPTFLSLENISLQWIYRFIIVEALVDHNRPKSLADWAPMFLHMVEQGLHFMVVMSGLLVLIEEGKAAHSDLKAVDEVLPLLESLVQERVAKACEFSYTKTQDYGESFRRHGLPGLMPRLWDKIARYAQLKADNRDANFEKKEDSARDLLGYSIIAYSLMLELPAELRASYQPTSIYETESNVMQGAEWKKVK